MTTACVRWTAMLGGEEEPELFEGAIVLAPALAHGHRELEADLDAEEALEVLPGRGADALEGGPALADDDALLRIVLDEDGGPDVQALRPLPLAQLLHADGARVRNLLVGEAEDLLADGLGDPEGLGLIRQRLPREIGGADGQRRHEEIEQTVAVLPRLRGDGHDLREGKSRAAGGDEREKLRLRGHQIGLVQDGVDGRAHALQTLEQRRIEPLGPLRRLEDETDHLDVLEGPLHRLGHEPAELDRKSTRLN